MTRPTERLAGIGIHTGSACWIQINPAETEGQGIVFRSAVSNAWMDASLQSVVDTRRCTVLRSGDFTVQTVEHLLSACAGMGVTDATIMVSGPEVPILDGSARLFVDALLDASLTECPGMIETLTCGVPLALSDGDSTMVAYPAASRSVSVIIEYPSHPAIGVQAAMYSGVNYHLEVAPARTYGFLSELEDLLRHGLALGAGLDNAVALLDTGAADPRTPLRFTNELARHKLLDVIGDLALLGENYRMGIVAIRPSHSLNIRFARHLAAMQGSATTT